MNNCDRSRFAYLAIWLVVSLALSVPGITATGKLPDIEHPDFSQFEPGVRRRMEQAARAVDAAGNASPVDVANLAQAYGDLGMLYHAYMLRVPAEAAYRNASDLAPDEIAWRYLLAILIHESGDFDQSISLYRDVLAIDSQFFPARIHLAQAYFANNRLADAKHEFTACLDQDPRSAAALYGLGGIELRQKKNDVAIDYYERALAIEPAATQIHYNLAQAFRKTGDRDAARKHLDQRGNVKPSVHDPVLARMHAMQVTSQEYLKTGVAAYEERRYADAVVAYENALVLNPDDPNTHLALAWTMELAGDDRDAMQHVDAALNLDPDFAQAHFSKGTMLEEAGDDTGALAHYRKAVDGDPGSNPPRLLLANALMRSGAFAEAVRVYKGLVTDQPGDVLLLYRLALAQQRAGDCKSAMQSITQALTQQQGSATLMQAYARLASTCGASDEDSRRQAYTMAQNVFQSLQNTNSGETLAMAAAANARFDQATGLQEQLVRQLNSQNQPSAFAEENLVAYQENRAAKQPWPPDSAVYVPPRVSLQDRMALAGIQE